MAERVQALAERPGTPPSVLILGAGSIAADAARHIAKRCPGALTITNRGVARGAQLAEACGAAQVPWSERQAALRDADVVVVATGARTPIVSPTDLTPRRGRSQLLIDAGMPRNVEPAAGQLDAVELLDIDHIRARCEAGKQLRRDAVPAVEARVAQELERWLGWLAARPLEGRIKRLYQAAAEQSRAVAGLLGSGELSGDDGEQAVYRAFRQLLHDHVAWLRSSGPQRRIESGSAFAHTSSLAGTQALETPECVEP